MYTTFSNSFTKPFGTTFVTRKLFSKKIVILLKFTNNEFADVCVDGDGELKLKNDYRWTGICNIRNLVKIKRLGTYINNKTLFYGNFI